MIYPIKNGIKLALKTLIQINEFIYYSMFDIDFLLFIQKQTKEKIIIYFLLRFLMYDHLK